MPVVIGETPQPGFDQPLALMSDCHCRIKRFLAMIATVAERTIPEPLGDQERRALAAALQYFREAAPKHTQDEEDSLFPRMRALDCEEARKALRLVQDLERQHVDAAAWHHELDVLGERWLSNLVLTDDDASRLRDLVAMLHRLYEEHIAVEDDVVFPVAGRLLAPAQLEEIGREMAQRRGLAGPENTSDG
jgi:hemerythrin-like domain-containing protein